MTQPKSDDAWKPENVRRTLGSRVARDRADKLAKEIGARIESFTDVNRFRELGGKRGDNPYAAAREWFDMIALTEAHSIRDDLIASDVPDVPRVPEPVRSRTTEFALKQLLSWCIAVREAPPYLPQPSQKELYVARAIYLHPSRTSKEIADIMTNGYDEPTYDSAVRRAFTDTLIHWEFQSDPYRPPATASGQPWEQWVPGFDDKRVESYFTFGKGKEKPHRPGKGR